MPRTANGYRQNSLSRTVDRVGNAGPTLGRVLAAASQMGPIPTMYVDTWISSDGG